VLRKSIGLGAKKLSETPLLCVFAILFVRLYIFLESNIQSGNQLFLFSKSGFEAIIEVEGYAILCTKTRLFFGGIQ